MGAFLKYERRTRGLVSLGVALAVAVAAACGSSAGSSDFVGDTLSNGDSGTRVTYDATVPCFCLDAGPPPADGSGHPDAVSLSFTPAAQTVTINGATPASATYTLMATFADGTTAAVNADSLEFDRPDLASVTTPGTPVTLTTVGTYAGTGTLHAVYGTATATATLTVNVQITMTNGVPPSTVSSLNGATSPDPSISSLLYPYDKTVWPLGLTAPLVMWNAPNATGDTYRLHLQQSNYTFDAYSAVAAPAQLRVDQTTWDRMTASNAGTSADPIVMTLSRWDGTKAYVSATISITVAPASLRGAIYYWTASQVTLDDGGILRRGHISQFRPGTGAAPVALNSGRCMGCHAVSADGTTLVADVDDGDESIPDASDRVPSIAPYGNWSNTRAWASFNLGDGGATQMVQTTMFGGDIALSPDARYVVFGGPTSPSTPGSVYMTLGDPKTGMVYPDSGLDQVTPIAPGTTMMEPAFSPDGTKLAVIVAGGNLQDDVIPAQPETINYLDFNEDAGTFAPNLHAQVSAADPVFGTMQGLGYPSFAPNSMGFAFHAGTTSTGCSTTCDDNEFDDGQLWFQAIPAPAGGGDAGAGDGGDASADGGDGGDGGDAGPSGDAGGSAVVGSPVLLNAASNPSVLSNPGDQRLSVEPTFNPLARGGYSWMVFTSMRNWGNELDGDANDAGQKQNAMRRLWVAAVDPTTGAPDPSHPAIYLEGQEDTPNMRGFWALSSCTATVPAGTPGGACGAGFECCSGFCEQGVCVDVSQVACASIGDTCTTSANCCNGELVTCTAGVCAPPTITPK
jgi:hypothetical protein